MLRVDNLKLIRTSIEGKKSAYELYDLSEEPVEMTNVFNDPKYADIMENLKEELDSEI
jgi:hypothetical protein